MTKHQPDPIGDHEPKEDQLLKGKFFSSIQFKSMRRSLKAAFATPYLGSEWYYINKGFFVEHYIVNWEAFNADLGDAS